MFTFCAVGLIFYGPSVNLEALSGSMYWNQLWLGLCQLPAVAVSALLVDRVGRKPLIVGGFALTAAANAGCAWVGGWQ